MTEDPGSGKKERRKKIAIIFLNFIFLWTGLSLWSLDPHKSISQYRLSNWRVEQGLPQNSIFTIIQTHDGYLWLGTLEGLVRFDGIRFRIFNRENTRQLESDYIPVLYEDRQGVLWIGTRDGGLTYLKKGEFGTYSSKNIPCLNIITDIEEDRQGTLWVSTKGNGITSLQQGKLTNYTTREGLPSNFVYSLFVDRRGDLWIGTNLGLTHLFKTGGSVTYSTRQGLSHNFVLSIQETPEGEIWVATDGGLDRVAAQGVSSFGLADGLPHLQINCLYMDSAQQLWVGTDGGGVSRFKEGKFETLTIDKGLADSYIYSFCEDRDGSLWIGTLNGGLHQLIDARFTTLTTNDGLAHDCVNSIREDRRGNLWISTDGGVNRFKDGKLALEFTAKEGFLSNIVNSVVEDRAGALWIGTKAGLHRSEQGKLTFFTEKNGLADDDVNYILEDRLGNIWVGTQNGLSCFCQGKFTTWRTGQGLLNNSVTFIMEDRAGFLWIGTEYGLNRFKDGKFTSYTTREGISDNNIQCIFEDNDGILWIGTAFGLTRMAGGKFTVYTTQNGLAENFVYYILEDDNGNLWMSGRNGIFHVSQGELADFAEGKINRIQPVSYDERDGMKVRWCLNGGCKSRDGKLWFATVKGVVMVDPANIDTGTLSQPLPLFVEELWVNGEMVNIKALPQGEVMVLPPGKKRMEFYYTALDFIYPEKIRFKLKLEGYDSDWIDVGTARSTIYTALPPGKYIFKIAACSRDGFWNESGASFSFYIKPYFSQTTWFYILVGLFACVAVFLGYRLRVRQLLAREKRLSALVELRTRALNQRTRELEKAHDNLQKSKQIIEEKNQNILASIRYACRIQQAILPADDRLNTALEDCFILFKPRDIVSGDFYWFNKKGDICFFAVVDCTGHGVPGALLSMIGNMKLDEIINEKPISHPAQLLSYLDLGVRRVIQHDEDSPADQVIGMEVALCMIDLRKGKVTFAGAKRPLFYIKDSEFFEIKGDRRTIGGGQKGVQPDFTNHEIDIRSEINIYLTTDGFADQNNQEDKKYGSQRFKGFLKANAHLGMARQKEALLEELAAYQGSEEQRDDITIIGIKLKNR